MRLFLSLLFVLVLCTCARAQIGARVDAEYVEWCMVDSLATGEVVRFTRILSMSTRDVVDVGPDGALYTVVGATLTCSAFDLREAIRDPLEDLYEGCQCEYTITQEDHRVSEIRGGNVQEWDVEYQEVVRRRCAGQITGVVVYRNTLTKTEDIRTTSELTYLFQFDGNGQFVDQVNFRYYSSGIATNVISIDLNPATVTTTYPGLNLDPADFSYNGSNLSDIAAAYQIVLDDQITGTTNAVTARASSQGVSINTQFLHEPNFPYVTQPRPGDSDYLVTHTANGGDETINNPAFGTTTTTSNYAEECEDIFTTEIGIYGRYSQDTPLEMQPVLSPSPSIQSQNSNQTAFCDVSPAICAELIPDPVDLGECVDICSDVLNIADHQGIRDEDITYAAQEYNSVSIRVTAGMVGVVLNGNRINYPAGSVASWSAQEGKLLQNSIRFDATGGGEAIIQFMK